MNGSKSASSMQCVFSKSGSRALSQAMLLVVVLSLSACGSKDKVPGQALVKVNGQEITVHQVNEELMRSNVPAAQKDAATKQLIEALIDRQLLQGEAIRDKVDRDPAVMQAIERTKSQIIAQAYIQKRLVKATKPTKDEIQAYFDAHPEFFAQRKAFEMNQLIIAAKDLGNDLKIMLGNAKSLVEVSAWLDAHHIEYVRNQMVKNSAELPSDLTKKMLAMRKGQVMVIQEGERDVLVALNDTKDIPVALATAEPQIGQFLFNKKTKEIADSELARLRAAAKIEYMNQPKQADNKDKSVAPATAPAAAPVAVTKPADDAHIKRGVAGL